MREAARASAFDRSCFDERGGNRQPLSPSEHASPWSWSLPICFRAVSHFDDYVLIPVRFRCKRNADLSMRICDAYSQLFPNRNANISPICGLAAKKYASANFRQAWAKSVDARGGRFASDIESGFTSQLWRSASSSKLAYNIPSCDHPFWIHPDERHL